MKQFYCLKVTEMTTAVEPLTKILGYRISERLYAGSRTLVYRAIREVDRLPVVIKILKQEYPTFNELLQFRNQYTIAKNLDFGVLFVFTA